MTKLTFSDLISSGKPALSDGAMGTLLHERGIGFNKCFDELNLTNPSLVAEIHHAYIEAGSQIILTNTFGANRFKLERHGMAAELKEINTAAVELARRVVLASFKDVLIGGDVGPLGIRLAPFGRVQPEDARRIFRQQIETLLEAGADLLVIETMSDLYEIREAIFAARDLSADIPVVASMTFTRDDRTLLGDSPRKVVRALRDYGADVFGVNCSGGPNQLLRILKEMRSAMPDGKFWIKPNAGWPEQMGGRIFYPASADYFGDYALSFWRAGASVIGGCCGTTPAHIAAMRQALESAKPSEMNGFSAVEEAVEEEAGEALKPTLLAQKLAKGKFVFAVEMDPPRGLSTHKLMAGASLLAEAGADVIDVADSPMARMRMSPWAVCSLVQKKAKIETVLHFPTRGRNLLRVQGDLLAAHALDVRNVFVIMGDPTAIGDYPDAMDNYDLAPSGLIKLIKQGFNAGVDHAGSDIGQPTSFFVGAALNLTAPDIQREIKIVGKKIEAGADFLLTQPIYSTAPLVQFLSLYQEAAGEKFPVPILAGILPLASSRHAAFLQQEVPGIDIPPEIHTSMQQAGDQGAKEGIRLAIELIGQLKSIAQGVYLMPAFGRFDYAAEIIETALK
ncbi:MAG: bifunctional homocysteine S-methyltransferase/methylenetetrahydrofolate reductase [Anaerolineae bacterium]|nr:bifunctional homocysteine S-methyltransferase/methylenetetrahydrofolate reductase [Anaerolineae bacterium]